jgi:hypothetical protein
MELLVKVAQEAGERELQDRQSEVDGGADPPPHAEREELVVSAPQIHTLGQVAAGLSPRVAPRASDSGGGQTLAWPWKTM